jgi:hypothetical protein
MGFDEFGFPKFLQDAFDKFQGKTVGFRKLRA